MAISSAAEVYTILQRHLDTLLIIFIMCLKSQCVSSGWSTLGTEREIWFPSFWLTKRRICPARRRLTPGNKGPRGRKSFPNISIKRWAGLQNVQGLDCEFSCLLFAACSVINPDSSLAPEKLGIGWGVFCRAEVFYPTRMFQGTPWSDVFIPGGQCTLP